MARAAVDDVNDAANNAIVIPKLDDIDAYYIQGTINKGIRELTMCPFGDLPELKTGGMIMMADINKNIPAINLLIYGNDNDNDNDRANFTLGNNKYDMHSYPVSFTIGGTKYVTRKYRQVVDLLRSKPEWIGVKIHVFPIYLHWA